MKNNNSSMWTCENCDGSGAHARLIAFPESVFFWSNCVNNKFELFLRWPTSATAIKKSSRQKRKAYGKKEKLTAKEKSSRQKRKTHGKKEKLTAIEKSSRQREKLTAKEKSSRRKLKTRGGSKNSWRGLWLSLVFGVLHAVYNQFIQRDIHYCSLSV